MANETLTVTDNRTGRTYEVPINDDTVRAMDFRQIKVSDDDFGLMVYDPGFTNTASCRSVITRIDGDRGILEYRGYPIEELADSGTFLEIAYLLIYGELPTRAQLDEWTREITYHTFVHENIKKFMEGFQHDAHPMGMLVGTVAALSTFYADAKEVDDPQSREKQTQRLIAKMPTIAAFAYRHSRGLPYVYPDNDLSYPGNFLSMLFRMTELKYKPDPRLERALDVLFILHADHEQNCSTNAVRGVGSSHVDPYSAVAAGVAALYGPPHGGANEAGLSMLGRIGKGENNPGLLDGVKTGDERLMGFGHRVYRVEDPRARHMRDRARELGEKLGQPKWFRILAAIQETMAPLAAHGVNVNVDFYAGAVYYLLSIPEDLFVPMFAIGRMPGWVAQVVEQWQDNTLIRPLLQYEGPQDLEYVPIDRRP